MLFSFVIELLQIVMHSAAILKFLLVLDFSLRLFRFFLKVDCSSFSSGN